MYTSRIVTYYVNNKNRTLACVYTRAYTSSLRNIDNLVRLLRLAAIFSPSSVCMWKKKKKKKERFLFCSKSLLVRISCMNVCMCGRRKKVHAFGREATTIMWQNCAKKKKRRKSLVLVATGIGRMMWWFLLALTHILCPFDKASHTHIHTYTSKINKH